MMATAIASIGVVIVSYNTRELLRACLSSLRDTTLPLVIVVVDNASRDGSPALVRTQFPDVELLEPGVNLGFSAATNRGLDALGMFGAAPRCDYALLLNPDTVVQPGAIESLVEFLAAHPRVGIAGPRLLNPDGSLQSAAFRFPTLSMTILDLFPPGEVLPGRLYNSWWHGRYPQEGGDAPFPIDHPLGACMLARPAAIAAIGPFDEGFFMYAEEVDWCYRMRVAGWAIWQVPAARVAHVGGASTRQVRPRMFVALYHSRLRFFRKHYGASLTALHLLIIRIGLLRATLLVWSAYARRGIDREGLRAQLWAYAESLRR